MILVVLIMVVGTKEVEVTVRVLVSVIVGKIVVNVVVTVVKVTVDVDVTVVLKVLVEVIGCMVVDVTVRGNVLTKADVATKV